MAIADFAHEHRADRFLFTRAIRAIIRWFAARRAAHARRYALLDLLSAPEHLLRDVGIGREQLIQAIEAQDKAATLL